MPPDPGDDHTGDRVVSRDSETALLEVIRRALPELQALLDEVSDHWVHEDLVYRFYHHSFKVYALQQATQRIVEALRGLGRRAGALPDPLSWTR